MPTDIDAFMEYRDKHFLWIEAKYKGKEMDYGQETALTRLCDAVYESGRSALLILGSHETPLDQNIDVAALTVIRYRYRKRWRTPKKVGALCIDLVRQYFKEYI